MEAILNQESAKKILSVIEGNFEIGNDQEEVIEVESIKKVEEFDCGVKYDNYGVKYDDLVIPPTTNEVFSWDGGYSWAKFSEYCILYLEPFLAIGKKNSSDKEWVVLNRGYEKSFTNTRDLMISIATDEGAKTYSLFRATGNDWICAPERSDWWSKEPVLKDKGEIDVIDILKATNYKPFTILGGLSFMMEEALEEKRKKEENKK